MTYLKQSGQATTEFIFVAPILLGIFVAALELSFMWTERHVLKMATFDVARRLQAEALLPHQKNPCVESSEVNKRWDLKMLVMRRFGFLMVNWQNLSLSQVAQLSLQALSINISCEWLPDGQGKVGIKILRPLRVIANPLSFGLHTWSPLPGLKFCEQWQLLKKMPLINVPPTSAMLCEDIEAAALKWQSKFLQIQASAPIGVDASGLRNATAPWQGNIWGITVFNGESNTLVERLMRSMPLLSSDHFIDQRQVPAWSISK